MTDIFAAQGIQISDITPGQLPGVNSLGQPTSKPSGRGYQVEPDDNTITKIPDSIDMTGDVSGADDLGNPLQSDNADLSDMFGTPTETDQAIISGPQPPPENTPIDIFGKEGITPPSISEQNVGAFSNAVDLSDPVGPHEEAVRKYADEEQAQFDILAKARFTPEQIENFQNNKIGFSEAFNRFLNPSQIVPLGGFKQLYDSMDIKHIAEKKEHGEEITPADEQKMAEFLDRTVEMNQRGFSWGGNIAYIGGQIPAFVAEFALSGGWGKAAQVAALKGTKELAVHGAIKSAVGVTTRIATQTALMPAQYFAKYGELRLNDYSAVTDKGQLILKESQDSPAVSALKAFSYTAADVAGQVAAPVIGKYIVNPVTKAVKTPLISAVNQLPATLKAAIYGAIKAVEPTAKMSKVFSAAGWSGAVEQLGANRVAEILKASTNLTLDKDYNFDQYLDEITPSKDQLLVEAGLIGIAQGVHTAGDITLNLMKSKGMPDKVAKETVDNMSANEKEQYVANNLPMPKSGFPESNKDVYKIPDEVANLEAQDLADGIPVAQKPFEAEAIKGQVKSEESKDPPEIIDEESVFNNLYRQLINSLEPIQVLPEMARERGAKVPIAEDTKLLSSLYSQNIEIVRENLQVATSNWGLDGNRVITGKSLKSTMDDFDNLFVARESSREQRKKDFNDYLVAQRYMEIEAVDPDILITPEQKAKSITDLARLADKYGDNFKLIEPLAQEVYSFQARILDNLVTSGVMAAETRDMLAKKYPKYVPLQRVMDEVFAPGISGKGQGKFTNANKNKVIKKLSGSEKDVKDVFHSIISNTAKILDLAARNNVARSVTNLHTALPDYIQKASPIIIKKGVADVKVTYDPKLRKKLELATEYFGGRTERLKSVSVKGFKNVLGSYSPAEKAIRLKLGTNESVMSHELGHMIDYTLGLKKKMLSDAKVKDELRQLAKERLGVELSMNKSPEGEIKFVEAMQKFPSQKYMDYIQNDREILANFFDGYVNAPEQVAKMAPRALKMFEKIIDADPKLSFVKDIKPSLDKAQENVKQDVYGEADFAPPGTVTVFNEGKREYYRVSKPILEAMAELSPSKINVVERILAAPFKMSAALLRTGATITPEFIARNILRDQHNAFLQSGVKYTPAHFIRGLFAALGKTDLYHKWASSGGKFNSYMALDDKGLEKAYKELFREDSKLSRYLKNPFRLLTDAAQVTEQATRVGVFSAGKKQGLSDMEAAYTALEATLNFARGGTVSKKINQYVPFFNAGVQGADKLVRTFKDNPKAVTFWATATITVPSVILAGYYLYQADEKDRQEYLEIPQWQKDMFWVAKVDGEWKRYPKPFTYGYLFGSLPERALTWMSGQNISDGKQAWLELMTSMAGSFSPVQDWGSMIPPIVKTAIEDVTNYNFFTGRSIYPDWMSRLEPENRFTKGTTETAKMLGKQLGVSPAIIDNTMQTSFGGAGAYTMEAGDQILSQVKQWSGEKIPDKPISAADIPLIKAFAVRDPSGYRSNSSAQFFVNWNTVEQKHMTASQLQGKEKIDYLKDNKAELAQYASLKSSYQEMKNLQKQVDSIVNDKNMNADAKVKRIKTLEANITNIARNANARYKRTIKE